MSEKYHPELCSREAAKHAFVIFMNLSRLPVQIYWIGYRCELVFYGKLVTGARKPMNTFETHPWIFKNFAGELMCVRNREVFWPIAATAVDEAPSTVPTYERSIVLIHAPMRTLKRSALISLLPSMKSPADIDRLPIPSTLKHELSDLYDKFVQM